MKQQQRIQHYYDETTQWFMRFGSTRKQGSIHRALYIDQFTLDDSTHAVHHIVQSTIEQYCPQAHILLDVGCGVGASLTALGELMPQLTHRYGVTLSNVQAHIAHQGFEHVHVANFHSLPYRSVSVDVVIAIESMIHSDQPQLFWQEISRVLRPGGLLIVCDDMLGDVDDVYCDLFQRGWHAPNLQTIDTHQQYAVQHGFMVKQVRNLTPHLRIVPVPAFVMPWLQRSYDYMTSMPLLTSTIGSIALQYLLARRAIAYTYMVFQRQ